jgi:hypothetical protein
MGPGVRRGDSRMRGVTRGKSKMIAIISATPKWQQPCTSYRQIPHAVSACAVIFSGHDCCGIVSKNKSRKGFAPRR